MTRAAANSIAKPTRSPVRGVMQIVRFNWPQYAAGAACVITAIAAIAIVPLPALLWWTIVIGVATATWWLLGSLAASWWIYDISSLTRWKWLQTHLPPSDACRELVNIHSGFDDTTLVLRDAFPTANVTVVDLYDPRHMTEPSIHRARKHLPPLLGTLLGTSDQLPIAGEAADVALLLLAAHELRKPAEREALFNELRRLLRSGGRVVLVEHARDVANFLAFGPGFWHFLPYREWRRLAQRARFRVISEGRVTPFVRFLVFEK